MKIKTLLAIIAISTIAFIGGGVSAFTSALEPQAGDSAGDPIVINADTALTTLNAHYYKFTNTWQNTGGRITINGTVQIELAAGSDVTINEGIRCATATSCNLTIIGTGSLTVTTSTGYYAGIGGNEADTVGTINIKGGIISTTGDQSGAGIGGGRYGNSGAINISGGTISAVGGKYAAAIGGGEGNEGNDGTGDGGIINISGGTIELALGGEYAAAIGGGKCGNGGTITISGGTIISTANSSGAGIGGGLGIGGTGNGGIINISGGTITATGNTGGAGIGGGNVGTGGIITISGGIVSAIGGEGAAGIGGGTGGGGNGGNGGTITISGGIISATAGNSSAGIGGGTYGTGGTITISGGIIESAQGGMAGAGIGGGYQGGGGTINISGGTILSAIGDIDGASGYPVAGIGAGYEGEGGTTIITGGTINAISATNAIDPAPTNGSAPVYLNTLTISAFPNSPVTAYYNSTYGVNGVVTDSEGKVYFYLPATTGPELVAITFDPINGSERYYGATYQRIADDTNVQSLGYLPLLTPGLPVAPLAETGLNLNLAYLLALLLLFGTVVPKKIY